MSNQPPYPGSGDPQGNPYGQPNPYGDQQNPYGNQQPNPYGNQPGYGYPQGGQPHQQPGQQQGQQPWQGGPAPQEQQGYADQQWQQQQYGGQYGQPQQPHPSSGRSSGGSGGKKKWLIPVAALAALAVIGGIVLAVLTLGGSDDESAGTEINSIKAGDCLTSGDIKDAKETVSGIKVVGCDKGHDAEAFATFSAGDDFDLDDAGDTCVEKLTDVSLTFADLEADGHQVRPLVASDDPSTDDQVVCIIRNAEGEQLTSALAEGGSEPTEESTE